jgi:hypothetical protein
MAKTLLPGWQLKCIGVLYTYKKRVWHNYYQCGASNFFFFFPLFYLIFEIALKNSNQPLKFVAPQDFVFILFVTFFLLRIIFEIKDFSQFHSYSLYYNFVCLE